jgi:hypothetical protein
MARGHLADLPGTSAVGGHRTSPAGQPCHRVAQATLAENGRRIITWAPTGSRIVTPNVVCNTNRGVHIPTVDTPESIKFLLVHLCATSG